MYYDPVRGRWLQRDPLGYAGGGMGLYEAFGGNPLNYRDPWGLKEIVAIRVYYEDSMGAFNKNVFNIVEGIFQEALSDKDVKKNIVFAWIQVKEVPRDILGYHGTDCWDLNPTEVRLGLYSSYGWNPGSSGNWTSRININAIQDAMRRTQKKGYPVNQNIAIANVIAHELGKHLIADVWCNPLNNSPEKLEVGNPSTTYELQGTVGHFSDYITWRIIDKLDLANNREYIDETMDEYWTDF